jgi:phenylacetic acid degradation protein
MHGFPGTDTIIEEDGHIGHGAVLHGCRIGRNALVGMNAVIMDNAVVGESSIVAACAFVRAGMEVPPRSLVAGVPAKVMRRLSEQEMAWKVEGNADLSGPHPTLAGDAGRDRSTDRRRAGPQTFRLPGVQPLIELRKQAPGGNRGQ